MLRPSIPRIRIHKRESFPSTHAKYFDDSTLAVSLNLKQSLQPNFSRRHRPLTYNESSELYLPKEKNLLQHQLNEFESFIIRNKMVINNDKSNILLFNMSQKYRFPPELSFSDHELLKVVDSAKILGVIVSNDLRWKLNTNYITDKARKKLWIIRRLCKLGVNQKFIIDVYNKEIRSILEYNVPVWNGNLTMKESEKIEKIKKQFFRILLGGQYASYTETCFKLGLEKLHKMRIKLCLKFSRKELRKGNLGIFKKIKSKS